MLDALDGVDYQAQGSGPVQASRELDRELISGEDLVVSELTTTEQG